MEGESPALKANLTEWRFNQYPKYILLPIDENHEQNRSNLKNIIFSEVNLSRLVAQWTKSFKDSFCLRSTAYM